MGCGCGKKVGAVRHVYTDADGKATEYNTEIEARAAQIRAGGGGAITTK